MLLAFARQAMDSPKGAWHKFSKHSKGFLAQTQMEWFWPVKGQIERVNRVWGREGGIAWSSTTPARVLKSGEGILSLKARLHGGPPVSNCAACLLAEQD
ncbi:MAG: hypothetical protein AUJ49_07845 [Desulfovibrionaceae bacterium CG1_02_65_16]|nr:MAG: hypothetical protein AUJ49_07845 [Desulfovibrionaceae bacterium CG1_02_65_16]